jgi:hypothetical protein
MLYYYRTGRYGNLYRHLTLLMTCLLQTIYMVFISDPEWSHICLWGHHVRCSQHSAPCICVEEEVKFPLLTYGQGVRCNWRVDHWACAFLLIPQVRLAHKYPISPWEMIHPPGEIIQYVFNLTRFTRLCVTSHSQPLINTTYKFQVTNYLQTIF